MKVITDAGETIAIGDTAAAPTIGIVDYSRRVTDDFGVTTVVQRGFSRTMSIKAAVPFDQVSALQVQLAELRATPATWVADKRFASLVVNGFFKDLQFDLASPPLSYCTLTVEGLASTEPLPDDAIDPAPAGAASTLQLLRPTPVTEAALSATTVIENDAPEWSAGTTYPTGARVMLRAQHRIYESLTPLNAGKHPVDSFGAWIDVGPTNRWAMFDDALGTITRADTQIEVTVSVGAVDAVALIDVKATSVRVRTVGYDRTLPVSAGITAFLDLPGNASSITVTIAGDAGVEVGTLLVGRLGTLGITEASPTAAITDFSRKVVDDFGEVTIVKRPYAKTMSARALIDTAAVDVVIARVANVRAQPCLWIGQDGVDAVTIYGFFKDFSVEVGQSLSKVSLSIEGMSAATKVQPLGSLVNWNDVADPAGTKPADNATNSANPASPFGPGSTVGAALTTIGKVPVIEGKIAPIEINVSALRETTAGHDRALAALDTRVTPAEADISALKLAGKQTSDGLTAVKGTVTAQDAAQRQIERDAGRLEEGLLRAVMESARTRAVLRDAGIVVDPASGVVRIYAVDQLRDRTTTVEQTIDAVKGTVATKATMAQVNDAIALAVLDPEQAAQLGPLIARLTQAETVLDGLNATVNTKASATELAIAAARITTAEQSINAMAGQIASKVDTTVFDALRVRVASAEQTLSALPDTSKFSVSLRQARGVADDAATAGLRALLSGDAASRYQLTQIAAARQELTRRTRRRCRRSMRL